MAGGEEGDDRHELSVLMYTLFARLAVSKTCISESKQTFSEHDAVYERTPSISQIMIATQNGFSCMAKISP